MRRLVLAGYGGLGRELEACLIKDRRYEYAGYFDDGGGLRNAQRFLGTTDALLDSGESFDVLISIADPRIRRSLRDKLMPGRHFFPNYFHPSAQIFNDDIRAMGTGNIIMPAAVLTTDISIGNFNIVHIGCYLSHDTVLGDFNTLMAGTMIRSGGNFGNDLVIHATNEVVVKQN